MHFNIGLALFIVLRHFMKLKKEPRNCRPFVGMKNKARVVFFGLYQTYQPHTLVEPTVTRRVQDPLAVIRLKN